MATTQEEASELVRLCRQLRDELVSFYRIDRAVAWLGGRFLGRRALTKQEGEYPIADEIERAILREVPVWEESFSAGPGIVCGVRDAALIASRLVARLAEPQRCQGSPDDRPAYIAFAGIEDATCLVEALGLQATTFTQETVLDEFEAGYGFCFEPVVEKTLYPEVGRVRGWPITGSVLRVRAELVPVLVQQITDAS